MSFPSRGGADNRLFATKADLDAEVGNYTATLVENPYGGNPNGTGAGAGNGTAQATPTPTSGSPTTSGGAAGGAAAPSSPKSGASRVAPNVFGMLLKVFLYGP